MATDAPLSRIKNKSAAPIQVSHEQLLREAQDRGQEEKLKPSKPVFRDLEELSEWQGRQRAEFEKYVRIASHNINNFTRYAQFELDQKDYRRARSVFERALEQHPTDIRVWMRYVDGELAGKNIGHARNLLDRAVTILPRVKKLWLKYAFVEEKLGNIDGVRQVFERWLQWEPDVDAWAQAIKFETKYGEWDRARSMYERMVYVHPEPNSWIKWARFEIENGTSDLVREVFSQAIEALGEDFMSEKIFIEYARFEVRLKEIERARAIYKFALDRLPRSKSVHLHKAYTQFEKQFGDSEGVEDVVLEKRRVQYEDEVRREPRNYDAWLDLARLEETGGDWDKVRDVYERAIAQIPPNDNEKRHWRRYIYLWLFYATWEELTTKDMERVAQIYQALLKLIPHKKWTSAKAWLNYAFFRVRQLQLTDARKILGTAIGKCPKSKIFKEYIKLELRLYEFDRARTLYEKYVVWDPSNTETWKAWAEMERGLTDIERAAMIYELGVSEAVLDRPEMLWKEYIDFEMEHERYDNVRELYERLLERAPHIKVWTSYAQFESSTTEDEDALDPETQQRVRNVFKRGADFFKAEGMKDERAQLLNQWKAFESGYGSEEQLEKVQKMMPNRVKKRRKLDDESYEEYMEWVFPDEKEGNNLGGLLAMAQMWKKGKE